MFDLAAIQAAIQESQLDGWLLYDFRGVNPLARRVVGLPEDAHLSRRWLYFIPAQGEPRKLVHRIETGTLDHLPGEMHIYLRWQEFEAGVGQLLHGAHRIAMEYVPRNANPYISRVDAGTLELVRSCGVEVMPSGDLIQQFEACWDDAQWSMHQEASRHTRAAFDVAHQFMIEQIRNHGQTSEVAVQDRILEHFRSSGLVTDAAPIVAVGPHSGNPHYAPNRDHDTAIKLGDYVLIDLWAKLERPRAVFSDLTRTAFIGTDVPEMFTKIFAIVRDARDAAIERVRQAFAGGEALEGWQVDQACREVIDQAGYGAFFTHRTGHSIGQETHGNGANIDNLETHETRRIMPRTCFSVEPGIYLPEFGVRNEVDVYIDAHGQVHVTGQPIQNEIDRIVIEPGQS